MIDITPKHQRNGSPEIRAALRIIEAYRAAFAAHGIHSPIHAPSVGDLADLIAGVEPTPRKALTAEESAELDSLIGN